MYCQILITRTGADDKILAIPFFRTYSLNLIFCVIFTEASGAGGLVHLRSIPQNTLMNTRNYFFLLLSFICTNPLLAQDDLYFQTNELKDSSVNKENLKKESLVTKGYLGVTLGNDYLGVSTNFLFESNWGFRVNYQRIAWEAADLPANFIPDCVIIAGCDQPKDKQSNYTVSIMRKTKITDGLRFGADLGISYHTFSRATFKPNNSRRSTFFNSVGNYDVLSEVENGFGFEMVGRIEWPILKFLGLEIGLLYNTNKFEDYFTPFAVVNLGRIR